MGCNNEKKKGPGRPKVKEKRKPRSIKATEAEWKRILELLKQINSPKAVAITTALESYLSMCSVEEGTVGATTPQKVGKGHTE